jgi:hypothetical protein
MAVRANDPEIAESIVVSPAIDVIELQRDEAPIPGATATDFAPERLQPLSEETSSQAIAGDETADDEDIPDRAGRNDRCCVPHSPSLT